MGRGTGEPLVVEVLHLFLGNGTWDVHMVRYKSKLVHFNVDKLHLNKVLFPFNVYTLSS